MTTENLREKRGSKWRLDGLELIGTYIFSALVSGAYAEVG